MMRPKLIKPARAPARRARGRCAPAGAVLLAGALLSACSGLAGPAYQRPEAPGKSAWSDKAAGTLSAEETVQPDWWRRFGDPYLDELVAQAIGGNLDIRVLAARTQVAEAGISQARAGLLPTLTVGAGTDTFKSTGSPRSTKYSIGGEASWEIDIWGKVQKGVEGQQAEFRATEADWRAGYLSVVSDVASTYFQIRQLDEQIDQQQRAIARNRSILAIQRARVREGLAPEVQVLQQEAEINQLQNQLLELERLRSLSENGLATLVGVPADGLKVPKAHLRGTVRIVEVPAGLPSDLLARRPDLVAAEYRVLAAYNFEGQARLARLPSISLTGMGGSASLALTNLLRGWTFGLSSLISFPIFDPSVTARIEVSEAQTKVAQEEYRAAVIKAFEEVENSLTNLTSRREQTRELELRRQRLRIVAAQVQAQLAEGLASQLDVLESERTLTDAEQDMLVNYWQIVTDTVTLYKALGGGWPEEVVAQATR